MTTLSQRRPFVPYSGYSVKDRTKLDLAISKQTQKKQIQAGLQQILLKIQNQYFSTLLQPKNQKQYRKDSHSCSSLAQTSVDEKHQQVDFKRRIKELKKFKEYKKMKITGEATKDC